MLLSGAIFYSKSLTKIVKYCLTDLNDCLNKMFTEKTGARIYSFIALIVTSVLIGRVKCLPIFGRLFWKVSF